MTELTRTSGILMHISSLPGDFSCGAFSNSAYKFIDFLSDSGFTYWQVLPFGVPDSCGSPYKSVSAFAGNPFFIDLTSLWHEGLLTISEIDRARQQTPYCCEFDRFESRMSLLFAASKREHNRSVVEDFIQKNPQLGNYCLFMAKKDANNGKAWWEWDESISVNDDVLFMHKFVQYKFFTQWNAIKTYANRKKIKIIGDMPIYVDTDSADVYFNKKEFLLGKDGKPTLVAGVPPDYFASEGQLWKNPLYDWNYMKDNGYSWWGERIRHTLNLFDGVRIDHFRAFSSFYAVDADALNAMNGKWIKGPGIEFIRFLKKIAGNSLIIAEDLGDIDNDVRKLVKKSSFPGMRVFQFGFVGTDDYHRPHSYTENCVAYSGTHDNNTLLGYLWEIDSLHRRYILEYCGHNPNEWESGCGTILKTIMRSSAGTVIFPVQDILGYGCDTRMNTPGKADGNWKFRITQEQLSSIDVNYWKHLNKIYSRI